MATLKELAEGNHERDSLEERLKRPAAGQVDAVAAGHRPARPPR